MSPYSSPTPVANVSALVDEIEITKLTEELEAAAAAYYKDGSSTMTDAEFDLKVEELRERDPESDFLKKVGATPSGNLPKIVHKRPMLSLNKATTQKDLKDWLARLPDNCPVNDGVAVQFKMDGASIELFYDKGMLVHGSTRGDGATGEDVTVAVRKAVGVPVKILFTGPLWVRGEITLPISKWAEIDPEMKTNPRNVGTGILNREDGSDAEKLRFTAFSCNGKENDTLHHNLESDALAFLNLQGFHIAETAFVKLDLESVERAIEHIRERRPTLEYAIDGAVIKFNSLNAQHILGVSSGRPKGQIAFKWPSDTIETVLTGVTLSVGHTGYIAPTAQLAPVQLMGVTVQNALLNNWDEIDRLKVAIGDTVLVERSGELIPKIIGVIKRPENRQLILEPTSCPECGGPCARSTSTTGESGVLTVCLSDDCPSRRRGVIKRWVKSLDILGIGDDVLDSMFKSGLVRDRISLYTVRQSDLAAIRVGNGVLGFKRADSILREVKKTLGALSISQFIGSLGAPYLGVRKAAIMQGLAKGALDKLPAWTNGSLLDIGPRVQAGGTAPAMHTFFQRNLEEISRLAAICLKAESDFVEPAPELAPLPDGKKRHTFLLTGKFDQKKSHYHDLITAAGHLFEEDFTKSVTHLVQADPESASAKTKKAQKAGIPVIGIDSLMSLIS